MATVKLRHFLLTTNSPEFVRIRQNLQTWKIRENPRNFDQIWVEKRSNFEKNHKHFKIAKKFEKMRNLLKF